MKFALHLGAHKTATTYIQNALELSQKELRSHGVEYPTLAYLRKHVTHNVGNNPEKVREYLRELKRKDCDRVILSDENFVGVPASLLHSGCLYPHLNSRMRPFADELDDVRIYFCIRSYDQFLPSYYVEIIRHQAFFSWASFLTRFSLETVSWFDVVSRIVDVFGAERVTLWNYADFRANADACFRQLTGLDIALQKPGKDVREAPSAKAMRALHALEETLSPKDINKLIWPVSNTFPKNAENGSYQPFDADMIERLQARFAEDIERIEDSFPAIAWLRPAPAPTAGVEPARPSPVSGGAA